MKPYGWKPGRTDLRHDYATTKAIWKRYRRAFRKAARQEAKKHCR